MSIKDIAKVVREENEFMPDFTTVKKDEIIGKEVKIKAFTLYNAKKEMYAKRPLTVIVAVEVNGLKVKAHFHNKEVVEAFKRIQEAKADVTDEVVTFVKIKLGQYDTVVIQ